MQPNPPTMLPIPDGSVVITPAQMYSQIGTLTDEVRGLKGVIDPALSEIRTDVKDHAKDLDEHRTKLVDLGTRLTILETQSKVIRWLVCAVIMPGLAATATVLGVVVHH